MSQGIPLNPDDPPDVTKQNQFQEYEEALLSPPNFTKARSKVEMDTKTSYALRTERASGTLVLH